MGALRFLLLMLLASARTSAARLLEWASKEETATALQSFVYKVTAMNMAFGSQVKKIKRQREKMWAKYHKVRTSVEFLSLWSSFTTAALGKPAGLILTQHLTNLIFRYIVICIVVEIQISNKKVL